MEALTFKSEGYQVTIPLDDIKSIDMVPKLLRVNLKKAKNYPIMYYDYALGSYIRDMRGVIEHDGDSEIRLEKIVYIIPEDLSL